MRIFILLGRVYCEFDDVMGSYSSREAAVAAYEGYLSTSGDQRYDEFVLKINELGAQASDVCDEEIIWTRKG